MTIPEQAKWDKNLRENIYKPLVEGKKCYRMNYLSQKKNWGISSRDFLDKFMIFEENDCIYKYMTAVPNCLEKWPSPDKDTIRGQTLMTVQKMYRSADGKLHFDMLCQMDLKLELPAFLLSTVLPSGAKAWMTEVMKHYNKNHKNL